MAAKRLTSTQKAAIKAEAVERGLIADIPVDSATHLPDFGDSVVFGMTLPEHLWNSRDKTQLAWLNELIGGANSLYTWHHHQDHGRMQLVRRGIHDATYRTGGRQTWAKGRR